MSTTHQQYEKLCKEIWEHNRRYYAEARPTISDEEFDRLLKKLEAIELEHPEWVTSSSPTQRVGEMLAAGFTTVTHRVPMLSLANTYSREELEDFIKRIERLTGDPKTEFSCELKMDGTAISVLYEKGIYTRAVTRGDGKRGDDVTANVKTIRSLPLQLMGSRVPDYLEIRGEVFMPLQAFEMLNREKEAKGEPLWANPRNAAAGSLKLLDPAEAAQRHLDIAFYGVSEESTGTLTTQHACHAFLHALGLPVLHTVAKCHTIQEIWDFSSKVEQLRPTLPFEIDGIVVKVNHLATQKKLGSTGKNPRWAVAYKFAAEQAETQIREITVQVGRTGTLTPVAELTPVSLAGSTISRATLHNEDEIRRKDIRVGDHVIIEKGGDVIPKVVEVLVEKRPAGSSPWQMPKTCPCCGAPVIRVEGEVAVRCSNAEGCLEQRMRRISYFVGKSAMDIDHLGHKVVERLVKKGFVGRPSDIFVLTVDHLSQLEGFKDKSIKNLLESIEQAKKVSLERFIMALAIRYVGAGVAELLANAAGSLEALEKMSPEELIEIEGVGEKVAEAVVEYFVDAENRAEIERLLDAGVQIAKTKKKATTGHPFSRKTFVLTGTLEQYTRSEAAALIKERGGKVSSSISKNTDYLLAGESPGSKLDKAKTLGVAVLKEKEFVGKL